MTVFVSLNPELAGYRDATGEVPPQLTLILTDTQNQNHWLILEGAALQELVSIVRTIQEQFPSDLCLH